MILPKLFNEAIIGTYFAPDLLGGGQAADAGAGGGEGEGGGGEGGAGAGAEGGDGGAGGSSAPEWLGGVSEDLRASEGLDAYQSLDDLVKEHVEMRGKIPNIPTEAAGYTPPEGVKEQLAEIEGTDPDKVIETWQENAAKYGMPLEVAQRLLTEEIAKTKENMATHEERMTAHIKEQVGKATATLKEEWKGDFQKNLDRADQALARVFSEDAIKALKLSGMAYNVQFIKDLHRLAPHVTEDMIDNLGGSSGQGRAGGKKSIADRLYN
jgi:hypothetical protein